MNIPVELQPVAVSRLMQKKTARKIYEVIEQTALSFNIAPALVCSRKELTMLLDSDSKESRIFMGWRDEFMQHIYKNTNIESLLKN